MIALLTMGVTSCQLVDVLDKKPEFEADLDGAITNQESVELALNGIYYYLPGSAGLNVIFPTVSGSFKAGTMLRQDLVTAGNAVYYSERTLPTLGFSDPTEWDSDYSMIKNANFLESACNAIDAGAFSGNRKEEVIGEIAFLKAFAYFRLMTYYTEFWDENSSYGLVIRDELPAISNSLKKRSTVKESYELILDYLKIAIEKAPNYSASYQASKEAAMALKAKVLFYKGDYENALTAINDVISKVSLEGSYGDIFDKASTTKEILFARVFGTKDAPKTSTRLSAFGSSPNKNEGYWGPTATYVELVGDDPRAKDIFSKVDSLESRGVVAYNLKSVKKVLNEKNDMPVIYMRTAELYLMKAEAIYRTNGSIADSYNAIKPLRIRAGATIEEPTTREALEDALFKEWLIEMSFEAWHEWFAAIRFAGLTADKPNFERLLAMNATMKKALDKEYETSQEKGDAYLQRIKDRRIEMIPTAEIQSNHEAVQNPGY